MQPQPNARERQLGFCVRGGFGFSGWLDLQQKNVAQVFSGGGVRWVSVGPAGFPCRPLYSSLGASTRGFISSEQANMAGIGGWRRGPTS